MSLWFENDLLHLVGDACMTVAGVGCLYLLVSCAAVLRFPQARERAPAASVPVTIMKPLRGAEPKLSQHLASFCVQDYAAPIQMICSLEDLSDPAVETVRQLALAVPTASVELEIDPSQHGVNRKVSNLANALRLARHDVLVMADSDIEVGPGYLGEVVAQLQQPGVGAVTCLYHGTAGAGVWSRYSALAINSHFLPNVLAALSFGLVEPCFGATIAMRRSLLPRIGGLKAFADCLADDYAIGQAVRAAGYRVAIPAFSIAHACFENDLRAMLSHELRVARTIKSINPLGYCGTIISHPLPLALIGGLMGHSGMLLAEIALASRTVLCLAVEHAFALERQPYWLIPMRDLLSFAVFVASFFGSTVSWRGFGYRVAADGSLIPNRKRAVQ